MAGLILSGINMQVEHSRHGEKNSSNFTLTWKGNKTMAIMTTIILAGAGVYGYEIAHQIIGRMRDLMRNNHIGIRLGVKIPGVPAIFD